MRLGVIVMCPWNLNRVVRAYAPDVLFIGWDARVWTRIAFRIWWSVFSLERRVRHHQLPIVVGIAQRLDDRDCATLGRPSLALAATRPRDRCRYRSHNSVGMSRSLNPHLTWRSP